MSNLVSDNQGRETARLARNVGLGRDLFQVALTDGTMHRILCAIRDGVQIAIGPTVWYPGWVGERLTPELEVLTVRNPGKVELWFNPRQMSCDGPTGHRVYDSVKANGLLERSLSLGNLRWYEQHPDKIPAEFRGKMIYAWASVVLTSDGQLDVPYLGCNYDLPNLRWCRLDDRWHDYQPAGLRAR